MGLSVQLMSMSLLATSLESSMQVTPDLSAEQ
jgi:hypothetical protein